MSQNDGRVTRRLQRLEEMDLVEPAMAAGDRRARPRQLTARGHRIAAEMAHAGSSAHFRKSDKPLARNAPPKEVAERVFSILRLVQNCPNIGLQELATCIGPRREPFSEMFARFVVELGEKRGLLDLTAEGYCTWGREQQKSPWIQFLDTARPEQLRRAFEHVPDHFVICTDMVEPWRQAFSRAEEAPRIGDVWPVAMAESTIPSEPIPALVLHDRTLLSVVKSRPVVGGSPLPIFLARIEMQNGVEEMILDAAQ